MVTFLIQSIQYIKEDKAYNCNFKKVSDNKVVIDTGILKAETTVTFKITFNQEIAFVRNHDYKWIKNNETQICNWYSPKIVKLQDATYIQANITNGIWETSPKNKTVIFWHFNIENSKPFTQYVGKQNAKQIIQANFINKIENLELLITKENAVEFSRSKIPFSSIACFTDHCDFDTVENLKSQRRFFKKHEIKVTKGFFLNDFSNRPNASFTTDVKELEKWKDDGHELAYHSLSQSIKTEEESFNDFETFQPPFKDLPTWIDHGYQPYNFSLFKNFNKTESWFENLMATKSISTLWNYIDSGTATKDVINQINPKQFTLGKYWKGVKNFSLREKLAALLKSILFHYYNNENYVVAYKNAARYFKLTFLNKKIKYIFRLILSIIKLKLIIFKVLLTWKNTSKKVFPLAKYTPVIFKHKLFDKVFYIFQTLEMVDFKAALCKENIDSLIDEKGLFIAHTYFSVPLNYHKGKMFKTPLEIDEEVDENFSYLAQKIKEKQVWNPTLNELISYFKEIETIVFDIDNSNHIYVKYPNNIQTRIIN